MKTTIYSVNNNCEREMKTGFGHIYVYIMSIVLYGYVACKLLPYTRAYCDWNYPESGLYRAQPFDVNETVPINNSQMTLTREIDMTIDL